MSDALIILDGNAMLHKTFHATDGRVAPDGVEVGAVLGVCGQLTWLLQKMRSRHVVMAFDPGGPVFRHELAADYKGNRSETPEDLVPQLALVQEAVAALGVATVCVPGFEADDCIATLTELGREEGLACWMVGIDKDLFQLVTDAEPVVRLFVVKGRTVIDEAAVVEKIGVPPSRAVDYFALVGDASDNISGVPSVGPKAASELLKRFDSLEAIYANLHEVTSLDVRGAGRLPLRLLAGRKAAELARELVRLRTDVPLGLGDLRASTLWTGPRADADALFARLGDDRALVAARALSPK